MFVHSCLNLTPDSGGLLRYHLYPSKLHTLPFGNVNQNYIETGHTDLYLKYQDLEAKTGGLL